MKNLLRIGGLGLTLALSSLATHAVTPPPPGPGTCITICSRIPQRTSVSWQASYGACCDETSTVCPDGHPRYGSSWIAANSTTSVQCPL
jgi:hypothetical protein